MDDLMDPTRLMFENQQSSAWLDSARLAEASSRAAVPRWIEEVSSSAAQAHRYLEELDSGRRFVEEQRKQLNDLARLGVTTDIAADILAAEADRKLRAEVLAGASATSAFAEYVRQEAATREEIARLARSTSVQLDPPQTYLDTLASAERARELFDEDSMRLYEPERSGSMPPIEFENPIHETNQKLDAVERQVAAATNAVTELGKMVSSLGVFAAESIKSSQIALRVSIASGIAAIAAVVLGAIQVAVQIDDGKSRQVVEERVAKAESAMRETEARLSAQSMENERLRVQLDRYERSSPQAFGLRLPR